MWNLTMHKIKLMKQIYNIFACFALLFVCQIAEAQIVIADPNMPTADKAVTITFDATKGTAGLKGYTGDVYAHTGVVTNQSNGQWKYAPEWGDNSAKYKMTSLGNDKWQLKITPSIKAYYGVPDGEIVEKMAFVFRSADKSKEGKYTDNKDIFITVYQAGLNVTFKTPEDNILVAVNENIDVQVTASNHTELTLFLDDDQLETTTGNSISTTVKSDKSGTHILKAVVKSETEEKTAEVQFMVRKPVEIAKRPDNIKVGINYIDKKTVTLCLYAPKKEYIYVIGDFNNWQVDNSYQMKKDDDYFWLTINDLTPKQEYAFQYLIDDNIRIADPYADKVLDPWNDKYIDSNTYPDLKAYPEGKTDHIVSVLETDQDKFKWSDDDFKMPTVPDLVVYELLIRDFTKAGNIKAVQAKLDYLQELGVNAVELMPFNEFEGNDSWGYNPSFYFAPDKAYGTKNDYKTFINECHQRGIAVIMDMVLNHSFGQSPMVRMYFDGTKPTAENPWYNVNNNFENPDANWGYDFNHESKVTQQFVDSVTSYWIKEYHIDGYRFDFTKGFSNTFHDNASDSWGSKYDAKRIELLERMTSQIWKVKKDALVIMEHLAENSEEKVLADYGILLWGNSNHTYNEATMGYNEGDKSDMSWICWKKRGWAEPNLMGYMESHDEERLMFKNLKYGNSAGSYNVKDLNTALERMQAANVFFYTIPGPKMLWQFGELGYDISIDEGGRTNKKPVLWNYFEDVARRQLYDVCAELIKVKKKEPAFESNNFTLDLKGALKRISINHSDMDVRVIGNFDVKKGSISPKFSKTGTWYEFFTAEKLSVTDKNMQVELKPGGYRIYTSKKLKDTPTAVPDVEKQLVKIYPNPVADVLHIDNITTISNISIYNINGQRVFNKPSNSSTAVLQMSNLQPGIYLLILENKKGEKVSEKIIKR